MSFTLITVTTTVQPSSNSPSLPSAETDSDDHRVRVGAQRRERMRMRLIESALQVFAEKGIDATDIKDVIETAQVSRGSFYNYFQTNEELMGAVLLELGNELLSLVDAVVTTLNDPVERVACGLRMVLRTASQYALLARFVSRVGIHMLEGNSLAQQYLPRDIQAGQEQGQFHTAQPLAALTMVLGSAHAALCTIAMNDNVPPDFPEEVAFQVLLGLGVDLVKARAIVSQPIEAVSLPAETLLARTHGSALKVSTRRGPSTFLD